ncbi:5' nucleotidase, NT5C type [Peribacillus huizhouensis]|uniref:Nucleotidase n=1 Tax=Peribacillus huizhouensis TaxID=1501239 RepID=A0ABR6CK43_9BACI|nr:hypothetical protein [Peribacillus huizhouensis]MBA9025439.1 hypothetical protein [Peribacillus huizhouensis]
MRKRLGIDIDGTITRPDTFVPYLNKAFQLSLTYEEMNQYDFNPFVNIPEEEFSKWFIENEPIIYAESILVDGAKDVLHKWANRHDLYFISARNNAMLDVTETWFSKQELQYNHIELIGSHDKVATAKKFEVDLFLEDKHDNAVAIAEECNIPVLLFDTPYNQDPIPNGVIRVYHWHEVEKWVENWLKVSL